MRTLRTGVFETNSSSTHSIAMCTQDEYDRWKDGELYYLEDSERFVTKEECDMILKKMVLEDEISTNWDEGTLTFRGIIKKFDGYEDRYNKINELLTPEVIAEVTQEQVDELLDENFDRYEMPCSYDEYWDDLEYETYTKSYTTESGEVVMAFGYYGNN